MVVDILIAIAAVERITCDPDNRSCLLSASHETESSENSGVKSPTFRLHRVHPSTCWRVDEHMRLNVRPILLRVWFHSPIVGYDSSPRSYAPVRTCSGSSYGAFTSCGSEISAGVILFITSAAV